jgi:hypothetical protein
MDENDPYLAQLGIDWAFNNLDIIDINKETIPFEAYGIRVVPPFDPCQVLRYIEPTNNDFEENFLDQIYNITTRWCDHYINPTANGSISWRHIHSLNSHQINFEEKNGPQNKKCAMNINFKRTNKIQYDDVNNMSKWFWMER